MRYIISQNNTCVNSTMLNDSFYLVLSFFFFHLKVVLTVHWIQDLN